MNERELNILKKKCSDIEDQNKENKIRREIALKSLKDDFGIPNILVAKSKLKEMKENLNKSKSEINKIGEEIYSELKEKGLL